MPNVAPVRKAGLNILLSALLILAALASVFLAGHTLMSFFMANVILNSLIVGIFAIGVVYAFFYLTRMQIEFSVLESVRDHFAVIGDQGRMSAETIRQLPSSFTRERLLVYHEQARRNCRLNSDGHAEKLAMTLSIQSGVTRYLANTLVFLGLLGTFIGLLTVISGIGGLISGMGSEGTADTVSFINELKTKLGKPLEGMTTAYGVSVFGVTTSLLMGFLHLQLSSAQLRFASWLESLDKTLFEPAFASEVGLRIPGGMSLRAAAEGPDGTMEAGVGGAAAAGQIIDETIARYTQASQLQMKENLDRLTAIIERTEESQADYRQALSTLQGEIQATNAAISALATNQDLARETWGKMVDLARSSDESLRMVSSQTQSMNEALARLAAAQQGTQKANEDFHKDTLRLLRQETGVLQRSMGTGKRE